MVVHLFYIFCGGESSSTPLSINFVGWFTSGIIMNISGLDFALVFLHNHSLVYDNYEIKAFT